MVNLSKQSCKQIGTQKKGTDTMGSCEYAYPLPTYSSQSGGTLLHWGSFAVTSSGSRIHISTTKHRAFW
jgi:hypothetical protein